MIFWSLGLGLFMGGAHVVTGPDHLAALACLASQAPKSSWTLGLRWGLGHSGGVLLVAAAVALLRGFVDVEAVSGVGEKLVGLTLIVLGVWGLIGLRRPRTSTPAPHAAFAVGTLHGAAGTSHVLGVLPGLVQPTAAQSIAYLGGFAAGTIAAMMLFAAGFTFARRGGRPVGWVVATTCAVSIACGAAWLALPAMGVALP